MKPIIFSGEMVRTILDGRKSQTRRVVTKDDSTTRIYWADNIATVPGGEYTGWVKECGAPLAIPIKCPYKPGDLLWVKETMGPDEYGNICYLADMTQMDVPITQEVIWFSEHWCNERRVRNLGQKIPSIFMPKWASRITLKVTEVRVQRLQDISDSDLTAEGMVDGDNGFAIGPPRWAFPQLWDSINKKKHPWDSNPYVWCISFEVSK